MRTTIKRAIPLFLLVTILLSLAAPASARASTHFASAGVTVTAKGGGKLQSVLTESIHLTDQNICEVRRSLP